MIRNLWCKDKKQIIIALSVGAVVLLFLILYFVPVRLNVTVTADQLYQYEDLTPEQLYVEAESVLGKTYLITDYELTGTDLNEVENAIVVKDFILKREMSVEVSPLVEITDSYDAGSVYAGEDLNKDLIHVTYVYEDGHEVEKEKFSVVDNPKYITADSYEVNTTVDGIDLNSTLELEVVPVDHVVPHAAYDWFAYDNISPASYTVVYADGTENEVEGTEITVTSEDKEIKEGENEFSIEYHELPYEISVTGVQKLLTGAETVADEDFYIDKPIPYDALTFVLHFEDETTLELKNTDERLTIDNEEQLLNYGENTLTASFRGQQFNFTVSAIEKDIASVEPLEGEIYIGEPLNLTKLLVTYKDGTTMEKEDFSVVEADVLEKGENERQVFYHDNTYDITVNPTYRPIVAAAVSVSSDLLQGDELSFSTITITYDNGVQENISKDDVELKSSLTMETGTNTINFYYHDQDLSFEVTAYARTRARLARRSYASEYANAKYKHLTDNIFATVTESYTATGVYLLTHVVINDPSQIKGGMSNDTFGGTREKPTKASARLNWVLGTNGSYFYYDGGYPALAGVFIKNGSVVQGSTANGDEMCLKSDGTLFTPAAGTSASDLIAMGVIQSWGTALPPIITNGAGQSNGSSDYTDTYPRTVYAMVGPCEYYIITAGSGSYKNGISLEEAQNILLAKGCTYARALDGGGSSSLVFENTLVNVPAASGKERAVADFVYFTE
jgi:exopolysaccharide biosynthesis protein